MNKSILLICCFLASSLSTYGQSKWSFIATVEENIHISDVRPSYNYINLGVPARNDGLTVIIIRHTDDSGFADFSQCSRLKKDYPCIDELKSCSSKPFMSNLLKA